MTKFRLSLVVLVLAALGGGYVGVKAATAPVGHAAGMAVSSNRLSTFRPPGLPCTAAAQTLTPANDTWVNENNVTQTNGAATTLSVTSRATNRNTRTLVRFTLPTTPTGCTLAGATLRLYDATPTAGRTIQAYRAGASWTDTVNWSTQPAVAGAAVTATSPAAAGWMQWSVLTHVQTMYSGTNTGFILRDATENAAGNQSQVFQSMDLTNKPELVLTWG